MTLFSPSKYYPINPCRIKATAALLRFSPLQCSKLRRHGLLRLTSPDTFRLQGFSPSCRFTSFATPRPCFMPLTLLRFFLQGFSPSQSLLVLSNQAALVSLAFVLLCRTTATSPSGLSSLRRSDTCRYGVTQIHKPLPSWFSCSPGISPLLSWPRFHGTSPRGLMLL